MKAGTTSLFAYLRAHPDVFMPEAKEIHFFSWQNWDRGVAWYESLFEEGRGRTALGEASPGYTLHPFWPDVPERIARVLPEARLVYVMRQPVDRIVSHYRQDVFAYGHRYPIEAVLEDGMPYLCGSSYAHQIEQYLRYFDRSQLLLLTTDELRDRRRETVARILEFIGVDPDRMPPAVEEEYGSRGGENLRRGYSIAEAVKGSRLYRRVRGSIPGRLRDAAWRALSRRATPPKELTTMSAELQAEVVRRLRPDLRRLRTYMGEDFHCWGLLDPGRTEARPRGRRSTPQPEE